MQTISDPTRRCLCYHTIVQHQMDKNYFVHGCKKCACEHYVDKVNEQKLESGRRKYWENHEQAKDKVNQKSRRWRSQNRDRWLEGARISNQKFRETEPERAKQTFHESYLRRKQAGHRPQQGYVSQLTHEGRLHLITRMACWGRGNMPRTIEEQQQDFLFAFKTSANIHLACVQAEINRTTVSKWLNTDPEFKQKYTDARDDAVDLLEAVARKRAIAGSDTLLMFLLKALRPDMYRDKASAKQWLRDEATKLAQEFNLDPAQIVAEAEQYLQESRH